MGTAAVGDVNDLAQRLYLNAFGRVDLTYQFMIATAYWLWYNTFAGYLPSTGEAKNSYGLARYSHL